MKDPALQEFDQRFFYPWLEKEVRYQKFILWFTTGVFIFCFIVGLLMELNP